MSALARVIDLDADVVELAPCPAPASAGPLREVAFRTNAWLPEDTERLRALFDAGDAVDEIAAALGRRREAVRSKIHDLGLRRRSSRPWSELEDAELVRRYGAESAASIAQDLGRGPSSVYARAAVLGVSQPGAPPYDAWEDAQIRAGYEADVAVGQIAALIGRPLLGVVCRAQLLGLRHACRPADWSDAELARMLTLAEQGAPYLEIIERLVAEGFPRRTKAGLGPRLRKLGYGRGWGRPWAEDEDALLRRAYAEGGSLPRLADRLGRTSQSVRGRAAYIGLIGSHPSRDGFRNGPVWSEADLERLRQAYGSMPTKALAAELSRPLRAVYSRAFALGLKHPWMRSFSPDEDMAIRIGWWRGLSQTDLAAALGRQVAVVSKHAVQLGLHFCDPARPPAPRTLRRNREPVTLAAILAMGLPETGLGDRP